MVNVNAAWMRQIICHRSENYDIFKRRTLSRLNGAIITSRLSRRRIRSSASREDSGSPEAPGRRFAARLGNRRGGVYTLPQKETSLTQSHLTLAPRNRLSTLVSDCDPFILVDTRALDKSASSSNVFRVSRDYNREPWTCFSLMSELNTILGFYRANFPPR